MIQGPIAPVYNNNKCRNSILYIIIISEYIKFVIDTILYYIVYEYYNKDRILHTMCK